MIFLDIENVNDYCLVNGGNVEFCGDYDSVVNFATYETLCYASELRADCAIINSKGYTEYTPGTNRCVVLDKELDNCVKKYFAGPKIIQEYKKMIDDFKY